LSNLLKRNRELFIKYALKYTEITVKHATAMKVFNRSVKQLGIPKTLSTIRRSYVANEWTNNLDKHLSYQVSGEYLMKNADEYKTPQGLFATKDVDVHRSYSIALYKGGRNETFMCEVDENTHWFDYDFT
jgi:hypothetical protein